MVIDASLRSRILAKGGAWMKRCLRVVVPAVITATVLPGCIFLFAGKPLEPRDYAEAEAAQARRQRAAERRKTVHRERLADRESHGLPRHTGAERFGYGMIIIGGASMAAGLFAKEGSDASSSWAMGGFGLILGGGLVRRIASDKYDRRWDKSGITLFIGPTGAGLAYKF